jgi:hypothetical protein
MRVLKKWKKSIKSLLINLGIKKKIILKFKKLNFNNKKNNYFYFYYFFLRFIKNFGVFYEELVSRLIGLKNKEVGKNFVEKIQNLNNFAYF